MPQHDIVLRLPLCTLEQIRDCDDPASKAKQLDPNTFLPKTDDAGRHLHICEIAVPGACPRVQCYSEESTPTLDKGYRACRLQALIRTESNESGFWMKLPCSSCSETRKLHPTTEGFVHGEFTP